MKWLNDYNIGIEEIDSQHKELFKILIQLKQSFSKDEDALKTFKFLVEYTESHFSKEEQFMRHISYPDYDNHKKIHEELISKVVEILKGIRNGDKFDPSYLVQFLTDWVLTHIGDKDKRIGNYYRESRADGK